MSVWSLSLCWVANRGREGGAVGNVGCFATTLMTDWFWGDGGCGFHLVSVIADRQTKLGPSNGAILILLGITNVEYRHHGVSMAGRFSSLAARIVSSSSPRRSHSHTPAAS